MTTKFKVIDYWDGEPIFREKTPKEKLDEEMKQAGQYKPTTAIANIIKLKVKHLIGVSPVITINRN